MTGAASLTETICEDPRWEALDLAGLAERAARATLARLALDPAVYEISILGAGDARIAALNGAFRQKPVPTNVLSWPTWDLSAEAEGAAPEPPEPGTPDDPESLGDIALAYETCEAEAAAQAKPLAAHVTHLLVHGTLHLLGFDHVRDGDAVLMERCEAEILLGLGIPDPYVPGET